MIMHCIESGVAEACTHSRLGTSYTVVFCCRYHSANAIPRSLCARPFSSRRPAFVLHLSRIQLLLRVTAVGTYSDLNYSLAVQLYGIYYLRSYITQSCRRARGTVGCEDVSGGNFTRFLLVDVVINQITDVSMLTALVVRSGLSVHAHVHTGGVIAACVRGAVCGRQSSGRLPCPRRACLYSHEL